MPRRRKTTPRDANGVRDFRHADARRPNNPPAGIAPTYEVRERQTTRYSYDPHLDPQLIWAGKAEHTSFEVDVVPLHIHERISTRAILEAVKKPEPQLALFGETPLPAHQQIEFYQHEVGWANRLILGDSLLVMNSLLVKEGMAGKVQMIYVDPPYGIKYASNFQPRIDRRDVKEQEKLYAVQTNTKVVERCILMTTDPGDLVFDPTCGSGTTAYCAEKWGRRWITCDTSRVALAIARQRLMTAKFDYYELKDPERGPAGGFIYETVPHITLESIAKNTEIDAIAARYQPQIDQALADLNRALGREWKEWEVPREVPHPVWPEEARQAYRHLLELKRSGKLGAEKEAEPLLETVYRLTGHRWENLGQVPDPMPPEDWPDAAKDALRRFWKLKRQKRKEIDESIQSNAPQETLYDRPRVVRGVVRVTGPFTVEAIPVPAVEDPTRRPSRSLKIP
jgi:hypothetical protein